MPPPVRGGGTIAFAPCATSCALFFSPAAPFSCACFSLSPVSCFFAPPPRPPTGRGGCSGERFEWMKAVLGGRGVDAAAEARYKPFPPPHQGWGGGGRLIAGSRFKPRLGRWRSALPLCSRWERGRGRGYLTAPTTPFAHPLPRIPQPKGGGGRRGGAHGEGGGLHPAPIGFVREFTPSGNLRAPGPRLRCPAPPASYPPTAACLGG